MAHRSTSPMLGGWSPLAEPPSRRRRQYHGGRALTLMAGGLAVAGFAALTAFLLATDPAPGLSGRSLLTLGLAGLVAVVLIVRGDRRGARATIRTLTEYAAVALLAALLVTTTAPPPADVDQGRPAAVERQEQQRAEADQLPPVVRQVVGGWGWLADRWHRAGELADRQRGERPDDREQERAAATATTLGRPAYRFRPAGGPPPPDHHQEADRP